MKLFKQRYIQRIVWSAIFSFLVLPSASAAEQYGKETRPTIAKAFDLIQPPPSTVGPGTTVVFKRLESKSAMALASKGFQVRIFSVSGPAARPVPLYSNDGCDIYLTTLRFIDGTTASDLQFSHIDASWLNLSEGQGTVQDAHYYLVFELKNANDEVFRLKSDDASSYFDQGFNFNVARGQNAVLAEVKSRYSERENFLTRLQLRVGEKNSSIPCYEFKKQTVAQTEIELETNLQELVACN